MQLDNIQMFLRLVEQAHTICAFDLEATGLHCDYNSILVGAIYPYGKKPYSFTVDKPGNDRKVSNEIARELEKYDCWIGYYSKGFDQKMLNGRLLMHGLPQLQKRHHIDMYYQLNSVVNTSRRSQATRCEWLDTAELKLTVGPNEWNKVLADPKKGLELMRKRCESDTKGLMGLYDRSKHLIVNITR